MGDVVLASFGATYVHASLGARSLLANLGPLRARAELLEWDLRAHPDDAVEAVLARAPRVVGVGVYVWNVGLVRRVVSLLKAVAPQVAVVLGGPEVSFLSEAELASWGADVVVRGEGELAFRDEAARLLGLGEGAAPAPRVVRAAPPDLAALALPYDLYSDHDLATRLTYVETTRGCPYRCDYCLSAVEPGVREVPLERVLPALDELLRRGARRLKFVDRSFNADTDRAGEVLDFLLPRMAPGVQVHLELVPGRLPPALRERLARFPAGALRLEVGVQTFDGEVLQRLGRHQDGAVVETDLRWLLSGTGAVVHADLLAGLPGEGLDGLARSFDRLVALGPHEIQLGTLKLLRGAPLARHVAPYGMVFDPAPPYEVLATGRVPFAAMQRVKRLAAYFELLWNRSGLREPLSLLWRDGSSPWTRLEALTERLWDGLGRTHSVALQDLAGRLHEHLVGAGAASVAEAEAAVERAWHQTPGRKPLRLG